MIEWAAGLARKQRTDRALPLLEPHARWYSKHSTGVGARLRVDWDAIRAASVSSANALPVTVEAMRDPRSEISHHLPTLSMLITELELRNVVELGVRGGVSTLALLEAVERVGGSVLSVDIEPCGDARRRVADARLGGSWRFAQMSDLDVPDSELPAPIDCCSSRRPASTSTPSRSWVSTRRSCGRARGWRCTTTRRATA